MMPPAASAETGWTREASPRAHEPNRHTLARRPSRTAQHNSPDFTQVGRVLGHFHFTPDINRTVGLISATRAAAATKATPATTPNSVGSDTDS